jgi:hypothetical protein
MNEEYTKLSVAIPKIMHKVMKNSTQVIKGFIFLRNRLVMNCIFDEEGSEQLLKDIMLLDIFKGNIYLHTLKMALSLKPRSVFRKLLYKKIKAY